MAFNHVKDGKEGNKRKKHYQGTDGQKQASRRIHPFRLQPQPFVTRFFYIRLTIFVFYYLSGFRGGGFFLLDFHYFDIYDDIIAPADSSFAFLLPIFSFFFFLLS